MFDQWEAPGSLSSEMKFWLQGATVQTPRPSEPPHTPGRTFQRNSWSGTGGFCALRSNENSDILSTAQALKTNFPSPSCGMTGIGDPLPLAISTREGSSCFPFPSSRTSDHRACAKTSAAPADDLEAICQIWGDDHKPVVNSLDSMRTLISSSMDAMKGRSFKFLL